MNKKNIAYTILAIIALVVMWKVSEPEQREYNKHMCAVYGYEEDCKTPLPEERRLR